MASVDSKDKDCYSFARTSGSVLYGLPLHQKAISTRLLVNMDPVIYEQVSCYTSMILFSHHFFVTKTINEI